MKRKLNRGLVITFILLSFAATPFSGRILAGSNPSHTIIRAKLKEMALKYNIPSAILMTIAYTESGWRQFDSLGNPVINVNTNGSMDIGIMQINSTGRDDLDRLKTDIFYNIEIGARILDGKWKITPGIGDRDRNILENWYYAIWAYNGFSYINHPANPDSRRYQEKVLDNLARVIIGDDGQPLWTPVKVSRPNPLSISNPPQWIPTPVPYHFGDLYTGLYEGDNFRLLKASDLQVVKSGEPFYLTFKIENIGTTTWKNTSDTSYTAQLVIEKDNESQVVRSPLASVTEPGGAFDFTFSVPPLSRGFYRTTLKMFRGDVQFGQSYLGNIISEENAVSIKAPEKATFQLGEEMRFSLKQNVDYRITATSLIEVLDSTGSLVYSTIVPLSEINSFSYIAGSGSAAQGDFRLIAQVFLNAGASILFAKGTFPPYVSIEKSFSIADMRTGLVIDSNVRGASINIDGQPSGFQTPAFIELPPGEHLISVIGEGFNPYSSLEKVEQGARYIYASLQSVTNQPQLSQTSLDFGSVYKGNSLYKNITLSLPGQMSGIGTVRTSARWFFVYPLSFTSSTTFTVSFDSRFIEEGKSLSGMIYFNLGGNDYSVKVVLTTLLTTSVVYILPESSTIREGDSIFLEIHLTKNNLSPVSASFEISFDESYLKFEEFSASNSSGSYDMQKGKIAFEFTDLPQDADINLGTLRLAGLLRTGSMSSSVNFTRAAVTDNGTTRDIIAKGCSVKILEKLVLPQMPLNLKGEGILNGVSLKWDTPQKGSYSVKMFEVYRSESADPSGVMFIGSADAGAASFTDKGPLQNRIYYYWVITVDTAGNSSQAAGPVEVRPIYQSTTLPSKVKLEFIVGSTTYYVNGLPLKMEVAPFIKDGRTFVPVRFVAQPFGAQVVWNDREKKVTLIHTNLIELWIGNPVAKVNGVDTMVDPNNPSIAPFIVSGRTMLPLRFVSESFGAQVSWDEKLKKVTIEYSTKK